MRDNGFLARLGGDSTQFGVWTVLGASADVVELTAASGFDWMLIDAEHSPLTHRDVLDALRAASAHPTDVIVRPMEGSHAEIVRLLDIGVQNLLIPMVETADQARAIVAATRYAPEGTRGVSSQTRAGDWGRRPGYLASARDQICLIVQIESIEGADRIDEILAVDGIDAVFIGTADLAATMGHLGEPGHPDVVAVVEEVERAVLAAGKPLGGLTRDPQQALRLARRGYAFVGSATDSALLASALRSVVAELRADPDHT
ncbi:HpcH/HpaI aldolase/citrate lyase family protein [Salinibacterium sp. ZJ70]|uniref:HpcH/HpaI aldolase family protein n=1 Tax=Salinibacterium sp. ZJ70 TaxID=2708084 RepID=UPI0014237E5A|nr:aldolase/citrate lyase family protein [Salinibacterium sp. ZJ70]